MTYKRFGLFATVAALVVGIFSGVTFSPTAFAAAQTCTWTGTAGDNKFSTATNWSNCGSGAPGAGDILSFGYQSSSTARVLTNDLGVDLGGLNITTNGSSATTYYINTLAFAADATITDNGGSNGSTWTSVYLGDGNSFNGTLTAAGNLTLAGGASIKGGTWSIAGTLAISSGIRFSVYGSNVTAQGFVVQKGATLDFLSTSATQTVNAPITLGGGSGTDKPKVTFDVYCSDPGASGCNAYANTTWTVSGNISLLSDAYFSPYPQATVNVTGGISGSGFTLAIDPSSDGALNINPSSNDSSTTTGSQAPQPVTNTLTDNQPSLDVTVTRNVTTILDGSRGNVTVREGGLLKGIGTVASSLSVYGGIVAPGHSPGCLTADTFSLYGEYQFELGGADQCTGYDQIRVLNSGASTNAVTLDNTTSVLTTSRYNDYTPTQGQIFTIIDQAGSAAVNGTFTGLPEGATFEQNGIVFKISYVGGDGNDVTLTVMNTPTAPDTGFELIKNNPIMVLAVMAGLGGLLVLMARSRLLQKR